VPSLESKEEVGIIISDCVETTDWVCDIISDIPLGHKGTLEPWVQLMVLQHRLGRNEDVMLRLEIQNAADGEIFESVTQAIAFAETMDRGLVQWVWGDIDLLFARCNRYLWSEKHDGKTAAEEMGSHFGMSDGSRSVRVCTWHTEFKTLNDTIVELGMVGK